MISMSGNSKMNNKGFSIVEVLVSVALAGMIAILAGGLMISGSKSYQAEIAKSNLQNSIQFANAKISKALMEATTLKMYEDSGVLYVLTGEWQEGDADIPAGWSTTSNPNGTAKAIIISDEHLYITDKLYAPSDVDSEALRGYEVTENMEFILLNIAFKNEITKDDSTGVYSMKGPIVVEVFYELKSEDQRSRSSFEVVLRNSDVIKSVYGKTADGDYAQIVVE